MQRAGIVVLAILWMVQSTYADNLSLVCRRETIIEGADYTFYQLLLGVNNSDAQHELFAWQLKCEIQHGPDASGLYFDFNDDFSAGAFSKPECYVFGDNRFSAWLGADCSYELLTVTDFCDESVSVPADSANLLQINFRAPHGASGRFDIVVVSNGDADSGWYDENYFFSQFYLDPSSGVVHTIDIPAEPSTIALLMSAISIIVVYLARRWFVSRDTILSQHSFTAQDWEQCRLAGGLARRGIRRKTRRRDTAGKPAG